MANGISNVTMTQQPTDYSIELADIERRRKLAEALQAKAAEPSGGTEMVGGWAIPKSPWEGAGKIAQSLSGAYQQNQLNERQKEIGAAQRTQGNSDVQRFMEALTGTPAQPAQERAGPQMDDEGNQMPGVAAQPAVAGDRQKALAVALQSQSPMVQGAGSSILAELLKPKEMKAYKPGDVLYQDNKPVGAIPAKPTEHVIGNEIYSSGPGGVTKVGGPGVQPQWSEPYQLGGQTVQKNTQTGQIRQAVTLPHQVNTNVAVSTDKSYAGHVAAGLAKNDVETIDAGRSAPQRVQSAQAVKEFLDKNPITGTFAEGRLSFEKGLATAGLIDGERVKNTEGLASTLANQTLDAIKTSGLGSGQGFTDKDRAFLERAKSGNIEINSGTLRQLADLNERSARASIDRANGVIKKLRGSKEMGNVGSGLDDVPMPPASGAAGKFKVLGVEKPNG